MICNTSALELSTKEQRYTWTADGNPVCLDDAMVAFRFWRDGHIERSVSSTDGGVVIGQQHGEFSLRLLAGDAEAIQGCSMYDVIAWLPLHGMKRITKGEISQKTSAIPRQKE